MLPDSYGQYIKSTIVKQFINKIKYKNIFVNAKRQHKFQINPQKSDTIPKQ